jgi:multiple sugar transport system permease protein
VGTYPRSFFDRYFAWIMPTPAVIVLLLLMVFPVAYTVYLSLAIIFNREFLGRGIFRTIFLMPMVATPVAIALVWMFILDINSGVLNYFLDLIAGARVAWLSDRGIVMWSLILPVQLFWYLTLPMLRPTLMVALMFRSIDALKTFDIIYVITQGGPAYASETLNLYGYAQGFLYFDMGYASALLVLYFILVLGVSFLFIRLRRTASEVM